MSKLPRTVAAVITARKDGMRTYTAFTKDANPVHKVSVLDCGQGAAIAIRSIVRAGFTISTAEWTYGIARRFGV